MVDPAEREEDQMSHEARPRREAVSTAAGNERAERLRRRPQAVGFRAAK